MFAQIDQEQNRISFDYTNITKQSVQKDYDFHRVFGPTINNQALYDDTFRNTVARALEGFNVCIFGYGQTGAGKTHTMAGDAKEPGIVRLAVGQIFDHIRSNPQRMFNIKFSCMEIYDEKIYDLLHERNPVILMSDPKKKKLAFKGLEEHQVSSESEMMEQVAKGMQGKTMTKNYKHDHSSRSHTVIRIGLEMRDTRAGLDRVMVASLMMVDLAGSEAAHKNESTKGKAEGISINKSLLFLKQCIHDLASQKKDKSFRNSTLTRLLEPSLSGGAAVAVICNMTPVAGDFKVAVDTLDFGSSASKIDLGLLKQNVAGDNTEFHKLQELMQAHC